MILKADPDKILRFVEEHFELLRKLYRAQVEDNSIDSLQFAQLTAQTGDISVRRLFDYKLLQEQYGTVRINEPLRDFLGFLLSEFKPLLPEELEKYQTSFRELFASIQNCPDPDTAILVERLDALFDEVSRFLENIEQNTAQLLRETQDLKANKDQMEYRERVRRARHLIKYYIEPLNNILDTRGGQSITNLLASISAFANSERLRHPYQSARDRYLMLHDLLRGANERVLRQSRTITRELLPMIDRLQTESEVLTGWLYFLERPYRTSVPGLKGRTQRSFIGRNLEAELHFFIEELDKRPQAKVIDIEAVKAIEPEAVFFNRSTYEKRLQQVLPVSDYFQWCYEQLEQGQLHYYLKVCSIVFENAGQYDLEFSTKKRHIHLPDISLEVPVIEVRQKAEEIDVHAIS